MNIDHPFWFAVSVACVGWYALVTGYVAVKGGADIKNMLARLEKLNAQDQDAS